MTKIKSAEDFFEEWFLKKQKDRHWLMRKPFGGYVSDKYDFAEEYADYVLKVKLEGITDDTKGQKAKLRERYFKETGIYPLDNLNRYNHWLEDEICEIKEWLKQKLLNDE